MNHEANILRDILYIKAAQPSLDTVSEIVQTVQKYPYEDYIIANHGNVTLYVVTHESPIFSELGITKNGKRFGLILSATHNDKVAVFTFLVKSSPAFRDLCFVLQQFHKEAEFKGLTEKLFAIKGEEK